MNCPKWKNLDRKQKETARRMGGYKEFKRVWNCGLALSTKLYKQGLKEAEKEKWPKKTLMLVLPFTTKVLKENVVVERLVVCPFAHFFTDGKRMVVRNIWNMKWGNLHTGSRTGGAIVKSQIKQ